ncbi:site-2 protease family protein [Patescibacteria group bacterium]|nr:site-2 protease family protein [Patescibacteria group bacterium]
MTVILFIAILAVLILVHELGHFLAAKKLGMRVDEFGIGFPPRLFSFKKGETEYSINLIPLGGFVKIFGEDPDLESISGSDSSRSLVNKPRWAQAIVMSAGVIFNIIFAWILISIGLMSGMPMSVDQFNQEDIKDASVVLVGVMEDSPAFESGLKVGDKILFMESGDDSLQNFNSDEMKEFISNHGGQEIDLLYKRGKTESAFATVIPVDGIIGEQYAIGINMDNIGTVQFLPHVALWEGLKLTFGLIASIVVGLFALIASLVQGTGDLSQVTGPVGIVGLVGNAAEFGFIYLLSFTAFISINLAVLNSIPFPALDGGRLLFIIIESVIRKNIKPVIANSLNLIGFVLLITLMAAVTFNDILKLF